MRLLLLLTAILDSSLGIIVDLPNLGKIEGWEDKINGHTVYKFEGVPYSEPPNRFEVSGPTVKMYLIKI